MGVPVDEVTVNGVADTDGVVEVEEGAPEGADKGADTAATGAWGTDAAGAAVEGVLVEEVVAETDT